MPNLTPNNIYEAILAGEQVTPTSREQAFLQEAVQNGSSETYETVAEIEVGEMVENHGLYMFQPSDSIPLAKNETLFFNSEEYPLEYVEAGTIYVYNLDASTGIPTGSPAYGVFIDGSYIQGLISDTPDLSNTTVRILKKVSEPSGGGLPEVTSADNGDVLTVVEGAWAKAAPSGGGKFVVTLTEDTTDPEHPVWSASHDGDPISIAEIITANNAGQIVVCIADGNELALVSCNSHDGEISVGFCANSSDVNYYASGATENESDVWDVTSQELLPYDEHLKPTYSFAFTVTVDQSDPTQYVCTPASGVTYAAITAALSETDNVYAVATLPDGGVMKSLFNNNNSFGLGAAGVFCTGSSFTAYRVLVQSNDSCNIVIKALANA